MTNIGCFLTFQVHNLPLKAKDGYSVTVDITAEYLVTDSSRNHFLELHKEDFADCQVSQKLVKD